MSENCLKRKPRSNPHCNYMRAVVVAIIVVVVLKLQ